MRHRIPKTKIRMVFITENLIRKRAEHNNCEISTLEEISLHQCDIEQIQHIDSWCRQLKILYLQSNLIPRIENVSKLKNLEYLNLALNNITVIENLQGCESLRKLDLTINFIGRVTSVETLKTNAQLRDLYLTGNPCTEYVGFRDYVIATLTQLNSLDGTEINKSERIQAVQQLTTLRCGMLEQEKRYLQKLEKEQQKSNGISGKDEKLSEEDFWSQPTKYTPESRVEMHKYMEEKRKEKDQTKSSFSLDPPKRVLRFFTNDGRPLNINEDQVKFSITENEESGEYVLDVACFKYVDTSLVDVDVQPNYVRVTIKGKILQLSLLEEVSPDSSSARRSQTTGHLLVTMPKLNFKLQEKINENLQGKIKKSLNITSQNHNLDKETTNECLKDTIAATERQLTGTVDIYNIVKHYENEDKNTKNTTTIFSGIRKPERQRERLCEEKDDSYFVDDEDVPPLE